MYVRTPWTTFDELQFVKHLSGIVPVMNRRPLLMGYWAGLRLRVNWEGMDAGVVREAAKSALQGLK